jgi:hypothetical protein
MLYVVCSLQFNPIVRVAVEAKNLCTFTLRPLCPLSPSSIPWQLLPMMKT